MSERKPKVFVFCNSCAPQWHIMSALSEDGYVLAEHCCSSHGFAAHDMGIDENGWKRDAYAKHYPDGFDVEWVENPREHEGINAAYQRYLDRANGEEGGGE